MRPVAAIVLLWVLSSASARGQGQSHADKLLHAGASAVLVDEVWAAGACAELPLWARLSAGVRAGVVAGVGTEVLDQAEFGTPEAGDVIFDAPGVGLGVAVALVVETLAARAEREPEPGAIVAERSVPR